MRRFNSGPRLQDSNGTTWSYLEKYQQSHERLVATVVATDARMFQDVLRTVSSGRGYPVVPKRSGGGRGRAEYLTDRAPRNKFCRDALPVGMPTTPPRTSRGILPDSWAGFSWRTEMIGQSEEIASACSFAMKSLHSSALFTSQTPATWRSPFST